MSVAQPTSVNVKNCMVCFYDKPVDIKFVILPSYTYLGKDFEKTKYHVWQFEIIPTMSPSILEDFNYNVVDNSYKVNVTSNDSVAALNSTVEELKKITLYFPRSAELLTFLDGQIDNHKHAQKLNR